MKKIQKIICATLISAAMLSGVSCSKKSKTKSAAEKAMAGIDVTDESQFTEFDPNDFEGPWIAGDWDYVYEINISDKTESKNMIDLTGKYSIEPGTYGSYQEAYIEIAGTINGEPINTSKTSSSNEIKNMLCEIRNNFILSYGMEKFMSQENLDSGTFGKPYFVINKEKSIIAFYNKGFMDEVSTSVIIVLRKI